MNIISFFFFFNYYYYFFFLLPSVLYFFLTPTTHPLTHPPQLFSRYIHQLFIFSFYIFLNDFFLVDLNERVFSSSTTGIFPSSCCTFDVLDLYYPSISSHPMILASFIVIGVCFFSTFEVWLVFVQLVLWSYVISPLS